MEHIGSIILGFVFLVIAFVIFKWFQETPEEKEEREKQDALRHENYLNLQEGAKVEILDKQYPYPEYIGVVEKKVVFNSWECDHSLIYFKVDIYKGEEKIAQKDFFDTQLKYILGNQ